MRSLIPVGQLHRRAQRMLDLRRSTDAVGSFRVLALRGTDDLLEGEPLTIGFQVCLGGASNNRVNKSFFCRTKSAVARSIREEALKLADYGAIGVG